MPLKYTSTVVFVGGEFPITVFDERTLFSGDLDPDQLKMGRIARYSYSSGTYQFTIHPERIDLECTGPVIVPDEVVDAAGTIASTIEPVRQVVRVSGFGMNCDTVLDREPSGVNGTIFCSQLFDPRINQLVGASSIEAFSRFRFRHDTMRYDVRIEPHIDSRGEKLFVAVNGHQEIATTEELSTKLERVHDFRTYVAALHQRISESNRNT